MELKNGSIRIPIVEYISLQLLLVDSLFLVHYFIVPVENKVWYLQNKNKNKNPTNPLKKKRKAELWCQTQRQRQKRR